MTLLEEKSRRNPDGLPLLQERFVFRPEGRMLAEGAGDSRRVIGRGTFGVVDVPTANGRVYRRDLMVRECNRLREQIAARKVFGELDHPADGKTLLNRVSHLITHMEVRPDGVIYGEMEVIPKHENGRKLLAILEAKGAVGVSSRGFGTTTKDQNGNDVVNDDYSLMTFDAVGDPAAASAYPEFEGLEPTDGSRFGESKTQMEGSMDVKELKEKHPQLVESLVSEAKAGAATAIEEARKAGYEKAKNEAAEEVKKATAGIVAEARAKVEEQYKKDPKFGGIVQAMEEAKKVLAPYILGTDAAKVVEAKDTRIAELEKQLREANERVLAVTNERDRAIAVGRRALFREHLEKRIGDTGKGAHPCAVQIRRLVGDISESLTLESLDRKIEEAAGSLLEERIAQRRTSSEIGRLRAKLDEEKQRNRELQELALQASIKGYVESACAGHPAARSLSEAILARKPMTKDACDTLFTELSESFRPSETYSQVRGAVAGGLQRKSMGPRGTNNGDGPSRQALSEDTGNPPRKALPPARKPAKTESMQGAGSKSMEGELLGVKIEDIQALAGVPLNG